MHKLQVLKLREKKAGEAQAILDAQAVTTEAGEVESVRARTPEEEAKFKALGAEIVALDKQYNDLEALGPPGGDEEEEEAPAGRSAPPGRSWPGRRSRPMRPGDGPAIHTGDDRPYSILRAIRSVIEQRPLDGLEGEVSAELQRRCVATGRMLAGQFHMPLGLDPEMRALAYPNYAKRADLTTSTGTGGIFTVAEQPFIELLRARLVLRKLGVTVLDDLQGLIAIPRQTGAAVVNWVGEGVSATPSAPTLDNVPFSPHTAIALTKISLMFTLQTSFSAETFVKNDLAKQMAIAWDTVGLNGTGGAQPTGLFKNSAVITNSSGIQIGTNGGNLTYAKAVAMESLIAVGNADMGKLAYVTSPALRGFLRTAPVLGTTFPTFIFTGAQGAEPGAGEINNYPAFATTVIPTNLTKGTGTGLTEIAFGNWEDLICGIWDDALSFLVNPFTDQANGGVTISTSMAVDFNVRHPESFAIITDVLPV